MAETTSKRGLSQADVDLIEDCKETGVPFGCVTCRDFYHCSFRGMNPCSQRDPNVETEKKFKRYKY